MSEAIGPLINFNRWHGNGNTVYMNNFWRLRFGRIAENEAMQYLKKKGYWIKYKNYRTKIGEIDLIAIKDDCTVFVEVKALTISQNFSPADHFDWKKQRKLTLLGRQYMSFQKREINARFDLITVVKKGEDYFIEHHENVIEEA